jgi:hypothetical protein
VGSDVTTTGKQAGPWWVLALATLAMFRLILTGDRDILALNAPYDEFWFVHTATRMIWGGAYNA